MTKVKDGAELPFSVRRQMVIDLKKKREAENKIRNMSPKEQKELIKAVQKNRAKEELSKLGKFVIKGEVNIGPNLNLSFEVSPKIGQWGINEGQETTLKEIAFRVYKDSSYWTILAWANGYARYKDGKVGKGIALYLPFVAYNYFGGKNNGPCLSQYVYIGCMFEKARGVRVSGNIDVNMDDAVHRVLIFNKKKCIGKPTGSEIIPYRDYLSKISGNSIKVSKPIACGIATAEVANGLASTIGGVAIILGGTCTIGGAPGAWALGGLTMLHGFNTFASGLADFYVLCVDWDQGLLKVNYLQDEIYKPAAKKVGIGEGTGTIIYATVDIGLGIVGTYSAFRTVMKASYMKKSCIWAWRGNWVDGFVKEYVLIRIPPPGWGVKLMQGTIVVRDSIIYYLDYKGLWYEVKETVKKMSM